MPKDLPTLEQEIQSRAQSRLNLDSNDIHLAFRNRFNDIVNEEMTINGITKTLDVWLMLVLAAAREKILPAYIAKEVTEVVSLVNKRDEIEAERAAAVVLRQQLEAKLAEATRVR